MKSEERRVKSEEFNTLWRKPNSTLNIEHLTLNLMNTKGFKQMLIGEKMPDKNDPKYKKRYERDVRAGRKFAKMCRIDKAAAKVQRFADLHKTLFLVIVFGFVGVSFSFNIYRMARAYHYQGERRTATERQDSLIKDRHHNMGNAKNIVRTNEDARHPQKDK